jgi:hypothetical protein
VFGPFFEEHLQVGQGLGPDTATLLLSGRIDLRKQGIEPVLSDEGQSVKKRQSISN